MQVLSQGLWVLCAEMGVAWHIQGMGAVSDPYLSQAHYLAKIEPFYWHSDSSNTVIGFMKWSHAVQGELP